MQLAQLQIMMEILRTGSLSKTAFRLRLSQSVISRQLAALETECGGRIFHRNGRGVVLTELGERILPSVGTIVEAAREMADSCADLHDHLSGEVRVSLGPQIAPILSGRLFTMLKKQYPNIRLSVWEAYSGVKAGLKEGHTDVAVFMHSDYVAQTDDHLIGEIDTYLVGPEDSSATLGETITFAELAKLPLLMPSAPNGWRKYIEKIAAQANLQLNIAAEVNAPSSTSALVHAGAGYLITPLISGPMAHAIGWIGEDLRARRLVASRIVEPCMVSKLIVSKGVKRNRSVDAVTQLIMKMLEELIGGGSQERPIRRSGLYVVSS